MGKVRASEPGDLSSIPRPHVVKGESPLTLYVCIMLHTQHNKKFKSFYILFVMCICVCLLYAVPHMSAEEASEPPGELGLQVFESHHMGAGEKPGSSVGALTTPT